MEISFITVNYNAGERLHEGVESMRTAAAGRDYEIRVVDNASTDGSLEKLRAGDDLTILRNDENAGFGAGCNRAAEGATGDLFWFVNPDAELLPGTVEAVVNAFEKHHDLGAASSPLENDHGVRERVAGLDPSPSNYWKQFSFMAMIGRGPSRGDKAELTRDERKQIKAKYRADSKLDGAGPLVDADWLTGAALCTRRAALDKIGPPYFDPRFFLYYEDADLCRRLREAGWRVCYLPDATPGRHRAGNSSGSSTSTKQMSLIYLYESCLKYAEKWLSPSEQQNIKRQIRRDMKTRNLMLSARRNIPADRRQARREAYREIIAMTRE